jgi:hypothetical protein
MIDDATLNDTDFVTSSTVNQYDLYDFGNLSSIANTVSAIGVNMFAKRSDAAARAICSTLKSGSATTDGANAYLAVDHTLISQIFETDPNTSTAWTAAGVNALQAGVKVKI